MRQWGNEAQTLLQPHCPISSDLQVQHVRQALEPRENLLAIIRSDQQKLFLVYHRIFKLGSKPAAHINALASLTDKQLLALMPAPLKSLSEFVKKKLGTIRE